MKKKHSFLARAAMTLLVMMLTASTAWADNVTVTSATTEWTDGNTYTVTSDVTISNRISVSGTVKLDVADGFTLTAEKGINVPEGATLTINETGTGTLTAYGVDYLQKNPNKDLTRGAAIGGQHGCNTGTINIKGGTVNATAADGIYAAAIGGGYTYNQSSVYGNAGTINISGGTVNATSSSGAAIGTGQYGTAGVVNISGGTVNAIHNNNGAAIGGGYTENTNSITSITISGGTVNATSTKGTYCEADASAIGGTYNSTGGIITISGGKITANGEYKGIGAGSNCSETASTTITIGLTNAEDYIDINSYNCGKVVVASTSQPLKQQADGGAVYAAGAEITDMSAINGQKLMVYTGIMRTVSFNSNGGSIVASQQVTDGGTAIRPEDPVKVGYSFTGWTLNSSAYDFSTAVTGDITLDATWDAVSAIDYIGSTGGTVNSSSYIPVYEGITKMNATDATLWVVGSDITTSKRVTVTGNVSLVLTDGATFTATKGITVHNGSSLTIYGQTNNTGILNAGTTNYNNPTTRSIEEYQAAIGGEKNNAGGTFTIYGGTVYAVGGTCAAAIGGGYYGEGGTINIHGGTVNAMGGHNAASIGGGLTGAGGNITIDGGSVNANSQTLSIEASGIGGGLYGSAGTIVISGGTVYASATNGAAIGNGYNSHNGNQGSITISGGTVQTGGGYTGCAGIGAGLSASSPDITISGGTVTTTYAIGEDSRERSSIYSTGSTITISGGNITAGYIGIQGNSPTTEKMTISLSWTNTTDQIKVNGFSGNLVTAAPKLYKINGSGTIATNAVLSAINAQTTLVPLTAITLANNASNSDLLTTTNGVSGLNVTLADRTLKKNGYWNTICLPFSLSASQIAGSPLANATLMEMQNTTSLENGVLTLNFTAATAIEAGKPYLIKWASADDIENPVFNDVTIASTTPTGVTSTDGKVTFVGQYNPFTINSSNKSDVLMLGSGNKIGYSNNDRTLKCFRAHFEINDLTAVREFNLNFDGETTGIVSIDNGQWTIDNSVYDLQGRKVSNPTKGLYIINGKKVIR